MPLPPTFTGRKALVIEDQQFIRSVVMRILKQLDFAAVYEAADGSEGLDLALRERPDVIICDIEMAPTDGLSFLKQLREREKADEDERAPMPVMFLTNHGNKEMVLKARDLGVNAFVVKPVTVTGLRDKLAILLPKKG